MPDRDSGSSKPKKVKNAVLPPVNATPDQIAKRLFMFSRPKKSKKQGAVGKDRTK